MTFRAARFALATLLACAASSTFAQAWPTKPVRIVLQFPPGGSTDAVARVLAQSLSQSLGQPVVVENKPGADGAIAAETVMRSDPDGHTVFMASNTPMMQVPLLRKNPPYDPLKDFTPITLVGRYIYFLVTAPSVPAANGAEFLAWAKTQGAKLNYASYSSVTQLMHARLKASGVDATLVPYKGEAAAIAEILAGRIHFTYATPTSTLQQIKDGRLKVHATLLPSRTSMAPEVPTAQEAGVPPLPVGTWAAIFGPAKMNAELAARVSREFNVALKRPDVIERTATQGLALGGSTPDETVAFVRDQLQVWGKAFKEAGFQPE